MLSALDFAETRSQDDARLLTSARGRKKGERLTADEAKALRRKVGGTASKPLPSPPDVSGTLHVFSVSDALLCRWLLLTWHAILLCGSVRDRCVARLVMALPGSPYPVKPGETQPGEAICATNPLTRKNSRLAVMQL